MAGNPRENVRNRGFWDGGGQGSNSDGQTAGRTGGMPGTRMRKKVGIRTDLEFPPEEFLEKSGPEK